MRFDKNKYAIVRKVLSKNEADIFYSYLLNKRKLANALFENKLISPFCFDYGTWNDTQVPDTYSLYGDLLMDTLLEKMQPLMEKTTKLKLFPNYSYTRVYKKGDILKRHKDRNSCEISTTLNLGGDSWPIYLEPSGQENKKGIEVNLNPGDMLIYRGCDLEHWREPFEGETCGQVFLHYNNEDSDIEGQKLYDGRICLGLPQGFRNCQ